MGHGRHRVALFLTILLSTLATASAAIPVADDAYTEHDYRKALLAFNRRTLHDAYEASGRKSEKWDTAARKLFDGFAIRFANAKADWPYALPGQPGTEQLKAVAQEALDAGCDDALVRYCHSVLIQDDNPRATELLPEYEAIAEQLNAPDRGPSWRGVWTQHRICQLTDRNDPAARANQWERFRDVAIDFLVRWDYRGVEPRMIYFSLWQALEEQGPDYQQAFVKALDAKPGGDPWLRAMILGSADIKAAWHYRGGGWAHTVTDGGWAGFYRHLGQARDHLAAAHKLRPNFPEAASEMITVAMGAGDQLKEAMRPWFDKAVAAQFDYAPAYNNYLWSIRPRWHGTIGQMYDFGVECAQTKRYDTRVPLYLRRALDDVASDMGGRQFWRQPGVYEQAKGLYDGLAASAAKRNDARGADWSRSELAAFAWRVARYDEARRLLDELGDRLDRGAFERVDAMGALAASHAFAMRPGLMESIEGAERLTSLSRIDEAIKTYRSLVPKLEPKDKAAFYVNSRIRQLQWQKQFDAGEWVDIQPGKDLAGWSPQAGKWEVDDEGGLVGTFVTRELFWLPCQGQFARGSIVVEGDIELLGEGNASAGVGMTYNDLWRIYGLFVQRARAPGKGHLRRDFYPGASDSIDLKAKNHFSFTFAAGRAAATVNGNEIFRDYDVSYMSRASRSYLGVGGKYGEPGTRVRFTNLRVRALNNPAEAPAPDGAPAPNEAPAPDVEAPQ